MTKIINQIREYHEDYTESELYLPDGNRFCYVLEDVGRPVGVKVPAQTCIPAGVYRVIVSRSNRWNKDMLLIYNNPADLSVERGGVKFTGIRPHGGTDVDDSGGCPLCAFHSDHNGKVWKRASDALFEIVKGWIDEGEEVLWVIS